MKKLFIMLGVITCLVSEACSKEHFSDIDVKHMSNKLVLDWNDLAYEAFGGENYQHSLMASRINAMIHIAMHDALNAIFPVYSTYAFHGRDSKADLKAAAASAAYTVLVHEIPEKENYLDSILKKNLSEVADSDAKIRGIGLGMEAGQAILEKCSNDGSAGNPMSQVPPFTIPGEYQAVPPFDIIFAPYWVDVKTFGLQKKDQFRSIQHPSLESEEYAEAFNEVKEKGKLDSHSRTEDETAYSNYWYEFSEAGWNRVARTIAIEKKLDLFETARLFALVDMAMADSYIAGWDSKFHYNFWRPYTAIRNAKIDNNDSTFEDLQWEPLMPTPPVQDYPSTHSALGNAAATVIAKVLGDNTSFTMNSPTASNGESRTFNNVMQAADENADSRVKAGIHFRFACVAGQEMGNHIGQWMVDNYLKPLSYNE